MTENSSSEKRQQVAAQQIDHVGVPLWRASTEFTRRMIDAVRRLGFEDISLADTELFPFLDIGGTGLSELAERKGVSRQAIHQSVHSLVKRGYLELIPDPDDARTRIARHSDKGLNLLEAMQTVKTEIQNDALSALGPGKMKELTGMLDTLTDAFKTPSDR